MSKTMEVITNTPSHREMEQRLNTLQTSLNVVETSITKFENLIKDCQMVEEEVQYVEEDEACLEEEICQEEEEITNVEMVEEVEHGDPKSSGPCGEAVTKSLHWSLLEMPSPQMRTLSSCSKHPNLKIQWLDLTAPRVRPAQSREGWPNYASPPQATLGPRRMRPHHRSLPSLHLRYSIWVLHHLRREKLEERRP